MLARWLAMHRETTRDVALPRLGHPRRPGPRARLGRLIGGLSRGARRTSCCRVVVHVPVGPLPGPWALSRKLL